MRSKIAWSAGLALLAAVLILWASNADEILHVAKAWAGSYQDFVSQHPVPCWLGLLLFGTVAINCPIPVAALIKVLSGYLFGVAGGFALNLCISVCGGLAGFMATRHLFHHALYSRFSHHLARANLEIARNGFWYVLSARLFMATPFFLVNVLAGLSCIRKRKFLLGTLVGVIPSSMIYAVSGRQLETANSISDLASPGFGLLLALVALLAILPAVVGRKKKKHP